MAEKKGCFNPACNAHKKKIKYKGDFDFCPACSVELKYVCNDRTCYEYLPNVLKKYCDECLQKRKERRDQAIVQSQRAVQAIPAAVVGVATVIATLIGIRKDSNNIVPKK